MLRCVGATADAFTLFERLEVKLEEHSGALPRCTRPLGRAFARLTGSVSRVCSSYAGQLTRAAVELAKNWRTDKYLRRLDVLQYSSAR